MTAWIAIVAVGIGSYAYRVAPLLLAGNRERAARIDRTLRYAGPAALTTLAVTSIRNQVTIDDPVACAATLAAVGVGVIAARRGFGLGPVVPIAFGVYALIRLLAIPFSM